MRVPRIAVLVTLLVALGAGAAHAASPNPPTGLTAKAGDQHVTLTWKAPTGGTAPVRYLVNGKTVAAGTPLPASDQGITWGASAAEVAAPTLTVVIGDDPNWALFNGETYWFSVQAVDAAGVKSVKNPLVAVVPYGRPGLPGTFRVRAGDGTLTVSNLQPGDANGSAIVDYTATATGGASCTATAAAASCAISGLRTGSYTVQVCSRNAAGTSTACRTSASTAVTSTADCGSAAGCGSGGGGSSSTTSGGGASAAPATATSASGAGAISVAAARVTRGRKTITVAVPVTATAIASLRLTVAAKAGRRTVGTCTASASVAADGLTRVRCTLGAPARAALRRGALRLTIAVAATPTDGSAAIAATRAERVARG